jgi:ribosome biogenesis GTPase
MELMRKEVLQRCFPEFTPYLDQCRFQDCAHIKEKGCVIRQALDDGKIQPTRYASYVRLYEQAKAIPDWQRSK